MGGAITQRCPGETGCARWRNAYGTTFEEKARACKGCTTCYDNPPLQEPEEAEDDYDDLVEETEMLIRINRAGEKINWNNRPYEYFHLFSVWTEAERRILTIQNARLQTVLKSFFQQEEAGF